MPTNKFHKLRPDPPQSLRFLRMFRQDGDWLHVNFCALLLDSQ